MKTTDEKLLADGQITISQSFGFSASHELKLLPTSHKCHRNHGHNYRVTASALVHEGGSGDLSSLGTYLAATFDHRLLNEQVAFHPTSELLASHLAEWFRNNIESAVPITLVAMVVSETSSTSARCDGATSAVTISKTFNTAHGDVTLILGADGLDEVGFVTDFGDLKPFAAYLDAPVADAALRASGPASVAHLASWFVDNIEPEIRGRLVSVGVDSITTTGLWERGDAS
ncbi:6-carboxytetrahydropterin synthase [Amycolatopsis saalfeldensis]|uniref:6-carboxy-5,6,7,8-tetrahydropterin synthase n=1 Tax=Amycolatopsis saalfeldensis TaxID=394193 RepID=A0A1H8YN09_9PSEU|nr:6-carboxytetrahydropterin synthase [Amycolatopsis saalfeldensis]SEP53381.1 6-pyruvoyl-tetrahydropterin synthase [Amycolatopsis saalfeldensis]